MKLSYLAAGGLALLLNGAVNYYIGLRGWQSLGRFIPHMNKWLYWLVFGFLAFSYIISRFVPKITPEPLGNALTVLGSYWLAAMLYFVIVLLIIDLLRFIGRLTGFLPPTVKNSSLAGPAAGIFVLLLVAGILAYGTWNAMNPRINSYELSIDKKAGTLENLHIAMVSDIHLGIVMNSSRLEKMVKMVNGLKPDVVMLAGDIVDEDASVFIRYNMGEVFKKIKAKYGVFAVLGNHEYYGGQTEAIVRCLEDAGIRVLRDQAVLVEGSFYIAGREDKALRQVGGKLRRNISELVQDVDRKLPVILMDHQPVDLKEASEQGIDLQLSGHTHRGQLFPCQYITNLMFEQDWGYLKKGGLHLIVSSGFGTWGPPVRVGNYPEVVDIRVGFR